MSLGVLVLLGRGGGHHYTRRKGIMSEANRGRFCFAAVSLPPHHISTHKPQESLPLVHYESPEIVPAV